MTLKAPTTAPDVGERLFMFRNAMGWSQIEMHKRAGIGRSTVILTENGKTTPNLATLRRMAWTFGVTVDEFLHGEPPEKTS